jgi:hypothetical protein
MSKHKISTECWYVLAAESENKMETFEVGLILDTSVADCYMMNLHGISQ